VHGLKAWSLVRRIKIKRSAPYRRDKAFRKICDLLITDHILTVIQAGRDIAPIVQAAVVMAGEVK
jgi:hypothetical protein